MCIKKEDFPKKRKVFAHMFLLPKSICEYGNRVFSLVAVSDDGKEFRREADQTRYRESVGEVKEAFVTFCRECGVKRGRGEVWYSESVLEEFDQEVPACADCQKRSCFYFVNYMLCQHSINTLWFDYEYEIRSFQLPDEETFQRFQKRCGYDAAKEPYAGRDLYRRYKEEIDKEKFTQEECLRMEEFIRNNREVAYADRYSFRCWEKNKAYLQLIEAILRLYRDTPTLCQNGIDCICENCESKSREEQRALFAFIESLLDEYCTRVSPPSCFEWDIWDNDLYRFMTEQEGAGFVNWIQKLRAEIEAENELESRRDTALRELEQKYKTDESVFGAMYMTPFGTLIDCSLFPNGHADVSVWLHEQGLEIDYRPGEPSQLLHLKGWLRLNTKVGYVEQSDRAITVRQQRRIAEIFGEEKKDG